MIEMRFADQPQVTFLVIVHESSIYAKGPVYWLVTAGAACDAIAKLRNSGRIEVGDKWEAMKAVEAEPDIQYFSQGGTSIDD